MPSPKALPEPSDRPLGPAELTWSSPGGDSVATVFSRGLVLRVDGSSRHWTWDELLVVREHATRLSRGSATSFLEVGFYAIALLVRYWRAPTTEFVVVPREGAPGSFTNAQVKDANGLALAIGRKIGVPVEVVWR